MDPTILPAIVVAIRPFIVVFLTCSALLCAVPLLPHGTLGPLHSFVHTIMARGVSSKQAGVEPKAKNVREGDDLATLSGSSRSGSMLLNKRKSVYQRFVDWTVPHQLFLHFYLFASLWNAVCFIACLISNASLELILLQCLFELHAVRRVLETAFVAKFSPSARMHVGLYLGALL